MSHNLADLEAAAAEAADGLIAVAAWIADLTAADNAAKAAYNAAKAAYLASAPNASRGAAAEAYLVAEAASRTLDASRVAYNAALDALRRADAAYLAAYRADFDAHNAAAYNASRGALRRAAAAYLFAAEAPQADLAVTVNLAAEAAAKAWKTHLEAQHAAYFDMHRSRYRGHLEALIAAARAFAEALIAADPRPADLEAAEATYIREKSFHASGHRRP